MTPPVCILLAAFNGQRHIAEQIHSLRSQTLQNWVLLVRDDGSTDETCAIVKDLAARDPRIHLLQSDAPKRLGAARNFSRLIEAAAATDSYIFFFCDQDDYWHPEKLERQAGQFRRNGREAKPLLVHSDLEVTDARLAVIARSLVRHMGLDPLTQTPLNELLSRNFVTGCAAACNRSLLEAAAEIPIAAIMHDWWLALVAATAGSIVYINEPLVKYRQHEANTLGAKSVWSVMKSTHQWIETWRAGNQEFLATFDQIDALLERSNAHPDWPGENVELLQRYAKLMQLPRLSRLKAAKKLRLRRGNMLLQMTLYLRLLVLRGHHGSL